MKSSSSLQFFLLLILLTSASCGIREDPSPMLVRSPEASGTSRIPAASSPTNEPTPTEISASTPPPPPTLIPEDAYTALSESIPGDANCVLPCWLGIIPGQTGFNDAGNILFQFNAIAISEFSSRWKYIKVIYPTYYMTTLVYPTNDDRVDHILIDTSIGPDANERVRYDDPWFRQTWQRYFLPELFRGHGAPEKIFLDTTLVAADPSSSYPYVLWVVYTQQGFLIRYEGDNLKFGDKIRICPLQSKITIKSWNPEMSSYEKYIEGDMAMETSLGPQPIESVTDFEIETFFEMFKESEFDTCFETRESIWPHP